MVSTPRLLCTIAVTAVLTVGGVSIATAGTGQSDRPERGVYENRLVSRDQGGQPANGPSQSPAVSVNARFVAYSSDADDIVAGDGNGRRESLSGDSSIAFQSEASNLVRPDTGLLDVFRRIPY